MRHHSDSDRVLAAVLCLLAAVAHVSEAIPQQQGVLNQQMLQPQQSLQPAPEQLGQEGQQQQQQHQQQQGQQEQQKNESVEEQKPAAAKTESLSSPPEDTKDAKSETLGEGRFLAEKVSEAGKVASIIAGDAVDAFKAMATSGGVARLLTSMIAGYDGDSASTADMRYNARQDVAPNNGGMYGVLRVLLRMLGLDETQLGSLALDVLVYAAEVVAKTMMGDKEVVNEIPQYRALVQEEGWLSSATKFLTASVSRSSAIKAALFDRTLPELVISGLKNRTESVGDTECVQLFICRMSPFLWGVQEAASDVGLNMKRSLGFNTWKLSRESYRRFPDAAKTVAFGKECDAQFPKCKLMAWNNGNGVEAAEAVEAAKEE